MRSEREIWIVVKKENGWPLMLQGSPLEAETEEKARRLIELYVAIDRQRFYEVRQMAPVASCEVAL